MVLCYLQSFVTVAVPRATPIAVASVTVYIHRFSLFRFLSLIYYELLVFWSVDCVAGAVTDANGR